MVAFILRFIKKAFTNSFLPKWIILIVDMVVVWFSCLLMFLIRDGLITTMQEAPDILVTQLICVLTCTISFFIFKTHHAVLRFSSFVDIKKISISLGGGFAIAMLILLIIDRTTTSKHSISLILYAYMVSYFVIISSRVTIKLLYDKFNFYNLRMENMMIFGAKEAGASIAKSLRSSPTHKYKLCGFIADESELISKTLMGEIIYRNDENLHEVLKKKRITTIVVSPLKINEAKEESFLNVVQECGVLLRYAPPMDKWESDQFEESSMKEFEIEDLLERDVIQIDEKKIGFEFSGTTIMVTGAAGSIGSELVRQLCKYSPLNIILIDQAETPLHDMMLELHDKYETIHTKLIICDVVNELKMERIFQAYQPEFVFHAAAYKHVPMMEMNVSEAIITNVKGTKIVADLSQKYKARKFIMVSTDKAVNPTNVMGASKRLAEIYIQTLATENVKQKKSGTQFVTTRFGNVLGSNGSVIPRFREQIRIGGPVTVVHPEITRYFMTIPEACRLVLEASVHGESGQIYVFDMGKPIKIVDLAKRMIFLSGKKGIAIKYTGLRPGEKLYEELLNDKESTQPTHHQKIMIASVRTYDKEQVKEQILELFSICSQLDAMKIVQKMKEIIPEFISQNSPYEKLDL